MPEVIPDLPDAAGPGRICVLVGVAEIWHSSVTLTDVTNYVR